MISIIICSRSEQLIKTLTANVRDTIGVSFEIIAIDNSQNKYGICEAYNVGARQAKYDLLCFMHEDIGFLTPNWGQIVATILSKPNAGVLGVAGNTLQPNAPGGWGWSGSKAAEKYLGVNVVHTAKGHTEHTHLNHDGRNLVEAVALDGLWLCCRKTVWEEFKFDAANLPGFHFYDVDFSVRVASKFTNYITFDILIEHFSHGTFDRTWMKTALEYYKKKKGHLPVAAAQVTAETEKVLDLAATQAFTGMLIRNKLHNGDKAADADTWYCLAECFKRAPLNRDTWYLAKIALKGAE
jgi:glycosyltransferase involved in cell wall biosynthesis